MAALAKTGDDLIDKVLTILTGIQSGDRTGLTYMTTGQYTQHNLTMADGSQGFAESLKKTPTNTLLVNVVRAYRDGDYVFTHEEYSYPDKAQVGFDVFRFENGVAVEHWDNIQDKNTENKGLSPSGHAMMDGPYEAKDLDKTEANKALVRQFVQETHIEGKLDRLETFFNGDTFIQHDPRLKDGVTNLRSALENLAKPGAAEKGKVVKEIKFVYGQGGFVLLISAGTFQGQEAAFYDLFLVENGKLHEHWNNIEIIPPCDTWKNPHGKF